MALGDFYLHGTMLSPYNLSFEESSEVFGEDVRLLSASLRRDIVARKHAFSLSWELLPEHDVGTYHALSDLQSLGTNAGTMTFIRPVGTGTGTAQYKVFCDTPEASLNVRTAGTVFYDVSLTLREG